MLANIIAGGFEGVVTPVNRAGSVVCSMRAARSLAEFEVTPELVIITAAGDEVLEFAAEAAATGARALLVLPAGPEDGEVARAREQRLLEIVRDGGLRMVGPSSLGVLNTAAEVSLNATFMDARVRPGALAIGSPSGAVGVGLLGHAAARQLGVSMFASLGSRADVSTNDLLECWEQDDRAGAVILYVETFGNPERFTRIARRVSRRKPILVSRAVDGPSGCSARRAPTPPRRCAATRSSTRSCEKPGCCASVAARSCLTPPISLSASRCRVDGGSES